MRRTRVDYFRLLAVALFLAIGGCVAQPITPDKAQLDSFRKIAVVGVQAPLLDLPFINIQGDTYVPVSYPLPMVIVIPRLSGPSEQDLARAIAIYKDITGEDWYPTVVLSDFAAKLLMEAGNRQIINLDRYEPLSKAPTLATVEKYEQMLKAGGSRTEVNDFEDFEAQRAWYNSDTSTFDYGPLRREGVDAVIEIGIGNYDIGKSIFALQIFIKIVDPRSNNVVGRTRDWGVYDDINTENFFKNSAIEFKRFFEKVGEQLVKTNLTNLGLLPPQSNTASR